MDIVNGRIINYSIKIKAIKNVTKFDIFKNKLYHKVWKLFNKQVESRELMSIPYIEFLILTERCKANMLGFSEASQKAVIISDEYGIFKVKFKDTSLVNPNLATFLRKILESCFRVMVCNLDEEMIEKVENINKCFKSSPERIILYQNELILLCLN